MSLFNGSNCCEFSLPRIQRSVSRKNKGDDIEHVYMFFEGGRVVKTGAASPLQPPIGFLTSGNALQIQELVNVCIYVCICMFTSTHKHVWELCKHGAVETPLGRPPSSSL